MSLLSCSVFDSSVVEGAEPATKVVMYSMQCATIDQNRLLHWWTVQKRCVPQGPQVLVDVSAWCFAYDWGGWSSPTPPPRLMAACCCPPQPHTHTLLASMLRALVVPLPLPAPSPSFREFVALHKALRRSGVAAKSLPKLPPKTLPFANTTTEEFLSERRALLGTYAAELLQRTCTWS